MKILELTNINDEKWNNEIRAKKLNSEIEKLRMKHDNEFNACNLKVNLELNEYKMKRETEFEA
jgi:hypothetical protein